MFIALCKHFHVEGFCIRTPGVLVGVVNGTGKFFYSEYYDVSIRSPYLLELMQKCPLMFKENASLSFSDIAYYCRKDVNDILFNFVKESMKNLCGKSIRFNDTLYKKISIEELCIENDLK